MWTARGNRCPLPRVFGQALDLAATLCNASTGRSQRAIPMSRHLGHRIRNVTAVLGPTNTGKTHLAIERMLGHQSGLIGLPLRLLAREVYDKIVARVGTEAVALVTGEEKIKPERP